MRYTPEDVTIVVCAYQECEFLEECILSIKNQTVPVNFLISTSTPIPFILNIAQKYNLEVRVNHNPGHANDYNFALDQIDTKLGIMAHQDDRMASNFVEQSIACLNHAKEPLLAFTNYAELHINEIVKSNKMLIVKRLLLIPARIPIFQNTIFKKRLLLRFGNSICHPTVTYVMDKLPSVRFQQRYKSNLDWDVWERMSHQNGKFCYCSEVVFYHRMHKGQATAVLIEGGNARYDEDFEMLCRFWPKRFAKFLMKFYEKGASFY